MSLRAQAAADLGPILDADGEDIVVVNPEGTELAVKGLSQDIATLIDPETGQAVAGRLATVAVQPSAIAALGVPEAITDEKRKPWRVRVTDLEEVEHTFAVVEVRPDSTFGLTVLVLGLFES